MTTSSEKSAGKEAKTKKESKKTAQASDSQIGSVQRGGSAPTSKSKKRKKKKENSSGQKGGVTSVKDYAEEIESGGSAWFESSKLELAKWMGLLTIVALSLNGYLEAQSSGWGNHGVPNDPVGIDWSGHHETGVDLSAISKIFLWAKGLAMKDGDIREVFKLAASFLSAGSFIGACNRVFIDAGLHLTYTTDTWVGCVMNLMSSKASIRRDIRKECASLKVQDAKTPKAVIDLDNDIAALAKVLRGEDKKRRDAIEILRKAYKQAMNEESTFKEETTPIRDYIKEYYTEKAGSVTPQIRISLVKRYHASEKAKSLYTLEQFINLYGMKQASKRIQLKVASFRSDSRFKNAVLWADKLEEDPTVPSGQEDEDMGGIAESELDESLLEGAL